MKLKIKDIFTLLSLIWLHSLSKFSEGKYDLSEILDTVKGEWTETYVNAMLSLCNKQRTLMCGIRMQQGNTTAQPIIHRDESNCCIQFHCLGYCDLENSKTTNCSSHIQSFHSSMTRQYMDYTLCMDSYKYLDENSIDNFGRLSGRYGHTTVSLCPENASTEEKTLCENMTNEELRPLEDTIPVTTNDVHFANRHCAACHEENSNYIFWDLKIHCTNTSNELFVTRESLNAVIKERVDCHLQRVPPFDTPTIPTCRSDIISSCNVTGTWKKYDKNIEDLCLDPFIGGIFLEKLNTGGGGFFMGNPNIGGGGIDMGNRDTGRKKYKNVFCALCNDVSTIGRDDCFAQVDPPIKEPEFSMLISFRTEKSSQTDEEKACPLKYIFVPLANQCMKTHCSPPMLTDILQNTCSNPPPPLPEYPKTRVDYAFKVLLDTSLTLSSRLELEEAISDSLSVFDDKPCVLTFAYELDLIMNECNDDIDGHFNVVYCYVQSMLRYALHHEVLDIRNRLPDVRSIDINGTTTTIQYLNYTIDPSFIADEASWRQHHEFHSIHNPYSKTKIMMFPSSECYEPKKADRSYSITYMECPSILLSLQRFDIERNEHGLLFKKIHTNVPFSDFRSLNSSHVYVCQETLLAIRVASLADQLSLNSFTVTIVMLVTLYHINTRTYLFAL